MAFPQTVETLALGTDLSTLIDESQWNPPRTLLNKIQAMLVGPNVVNAVGKGADPSGAADSSAAIRSAIDDLGTGGGTVYVPPGDYRMDSLVKVPSRVSIVGAGKYATRFFQPAANPDTFMFEVATTTANTLTNVYSQVYGVSFEDFEIRDRASADTALTLTGRSEDHHGILVHDSDWGLMLNINFRDLQGRAIHMSNVVREWYCENVHTWNCGEAAESLPAVDIGATSGDASNTIYFVNCRVVYSQWLGVRVDGAIDNIRLINFTDCQFEGGGNGSGGTFGNPWPYDIVWLGRLNDCVFNACEWSNPGSGKWCLNVDGNASTPAQRVDVDLARFNGQSLGGGIRVNRVQFLGVSQTYWAASTAGAADFYVETLAGAIWSDPANSHSANPTAGSPAGHFRGKESDTKLNYENHYLNMSGGGMSAMVGGKPTTNQNLGFETPGGVTVYDVTNHHYWDRVYVPEGGSYYWMPRGVVGRHVGAAHASDTNENSIFAYTIAAGTITGFGGFRVVVWGYFTGVNTGTATLRIKLGGTTIFADATVALINGEQQWRLEFDFRNTAASNNNRLSGTFWVAPINAATTGKGDIGTDENTAAGPIAAVTSIAMNSSQALDITIQHSTAKQTVVDNGYLEWK